MLRGLINKLDPRRIRNPQHAARKKIIKVNRIWDESAPV